MFSVEEDLTTPPITLPNASLHSKKVVRIEYTIDNLPVTNDQILNILEKHTLIELGTRFSRNAIRLSISSLYSLNQFSQINVYTKDRPEGVEVHFKLENVMQLQTIVIVGVDSDKLNKALRDTIRLEPGGMYLPTIANRDELSIKEVCADNGYFNSKVETIAETDTGKLTFQIDLGNPTIVSKFHIQGNSTLFSEYLKGIAGEFVGKVYRKSDVNDAILEIQDFYKEKYYPNSDIVADFNNVTGLLTIRIVEGTQLLLEFVDEKGKQIFSDFTVVDILKQIGIAKGESEKDLLRNRIITYLNSETLWSQTVKSHFERQGYDNTTVEWEKLTNSPLHIKFTVIKGQRYIVKDIIFEGNFAFSEQELLREIDTKPYHITTQLFRRHIFTQQELTEDLERLRILYQKAGYPNASIRVQQLDKKLSKPSNFGEVSIRITVFEDRKEVINRCVFSGNKVLDTALLLNALPTKPPQPNAPLVLKSYQNAILKVYQDQGYMDVEITNPPIEQYIDKMETPAFQVEGNFSDMLDSGLIPRDVREEFEKHGLPLSGTFIASSIGDEWSIQDNNNNPRYTLKQEETTLSVFEHGLVYFKINEGHQIRFGEIYFPGDTGVRQFVLNREVAHLQGTLFTPDKLSKTIQNLNSTGVFEAGIRTERRIKSEIEVNTYQDVPSESGSEFSPKPIYQDVSIRLQKRKPGAYGASIGYSSSDGPRGTISLSHLNLLQRNNKFRLRGRWGTRGYLYDTTLTEPWLFGRTSGSLQFLGRKLEEDDGVRALQGSFTLSRRLYESHRFNLEYSYRGLRDTSETISGINPSTTVSSLRFLWRQDNRLPPINPKTGMLHEVTVEYAGGFLGGKSSFIKTIADFRDHRLLNGRGLVLAPAVRFGITTGLEQEDQDSELISFERFWAGGSTTVRGYEERGLGPVDSTGKHRGNIQFIFNTELRFPIFTPFDGVLFFDSGNVWDSFEEIKLEWLPSSVGVGLRIDIGPFIGGIDYAVPLITVPDVPINTLYIRVGTPY
ncbi:BamA/TamA family outer membrane protein [Candidatus Poribacteria bacterium]|nr:BamA/TamA family outer membrane protein [Candidatus Poribacteria bacterium]